MKKNTVLYWVATIIIFLWDSVIPAFTSHTQLAVEGIRHLGYPDYFRVALTVFKVAGGILLIVPAVPARVKEWAYAGFGFNFIFASVSIIATDGFNIGLLLPAVMMVLLALSYVNYHKIRNSKLATPPVANLT